MSRFFRLAILAAAFGFGRQAAADSAGDSVLAVSRAIVGTTADGVPAAYRNRGAECAFNGAGLNASGTAHGTDADGAMFMLSSNDSGAFPFYVQVDFGSVKLIHSVRIFNFNFAKGGASYTSRGIRNFKLYVSTAPSWRTSTSGIVSNYRRVLADVLPEASGTDSYPGTLFALDSPVESRFAAIVAFDDWDDATDRLNYNGLSEVVFYGEDSSSPEEPRIPTWSAGGVLLEAESFSKKGGWVVDPQFVDSMGSPYLLAHGKGVPVSDASTEVDFFGAGGSIRAWVRTRDWTPDWDGPDSGRPGRFRLSVCGEESGDLGVSPPAWGWIDAGVFEVPNGPGVVSLRDMTGFDGRCDAVWLAPVDALESPPAVGKPLETWRAAMRGEVGPPDDIVEAEFVVIGGGIAGTCAAVAAADAGLSVALVQDRPMLGGNASDEVRVKTQNEGDEFHWIVRAVRNTRANGSVETATDDARRAAFVAGFPGVECHLGWRAYGVETNAERRIVAVDARNVETGARRRFVAPLFADCTGDGWLGFWAGAAYRVGRESADEFGESLAPAVADSSTMGNSLMWSSKTASGDMAFPDVPWAMQIAGSEAAVSGGWQWEAGLGTDEDTIYDAEALRDRVLRAIYGRFRTAKRDPANARRVLDFVPFVAGKRESRRIVGDYIVRQDDITGVRRFEDAIGVATWSIDLHFYDPSQPGGALGYIAATKQVAVPAWWMPYRSLCCRDVPNLFMAGRCASYTHVALGSSRVMHAGGQQGVAVGYAAALCRAWNCEPREVYRDGEKTAVLQSMINARGDYEWPDPAPERELVSLVVDNDDPDCVEVSGGWLASSHSDVRIGADYLHSGLAASDDLWVRYVPHIPTSATYRVTMSWNGNSSRGGSVPVEIVHDGGVATNYVDQTSSTGLWNAIGEWPFSAGTSGSVRILTSGQEGKYVIADAVRFAVVERDRSADADRNGIPDAWERRHFLRLCGADPEGDPDADGLSNLGEWLADTDPQDGGSFFSVGGISVSPPSPAGAGRVVSLSWPSVEGRTYTVLRAERPGEEFVPYVVGVPATPPENVLPLPADDSDSAFYRVSIDVP